ncbi:MAG: arsenate reductase ArsC [Planctomycetota bacterium]
MSEKPNVLFLCTHNSARSVLAEGLLRDLAGDRVNVFSAGVEPGRTNPFAVAALAEVGIDASSAVSEGVTEYIEKELVVHHLVIVCDGAAGRCPTAWPTMIEKHVWAFEDPSRVDGTDEEKLAAFRETRELIKAKLESELELLTSLPG